MWVIYEDLVKRAKFSDIGWASGNRCDIRITPDRSSG